jgi:3-oxoacyl-[acyl-carrier protein] reductase
VASSSFAPNIPRERLALAAGPGQEPAEVCLADFRGNGCKTEASFFDVGDSGAVHAAVAEIIERHGHLDIVVNNAGIGDFVEFVVITPDNWRRLSDVHLTGHSTARMPCSLT